MLLLSSAGGSLKGLGFVIGWVLTLVGVVVLTLALTGGKPVQPGSVPSTAALIVKILLGILLVWLAWRQRAGPAGHDLTMVPRTDGGVCNQMVERWAIVALLRRWGEMIDGG